MARIEKISTRKVSILQFSCLIFEYRVTGRLNEFLQIMALQKERRLTLKSSSAEVTDRNSNIVINQRFRKARQGSRSCSKIDLIWIMLYEWFNMNESSNLWNFSWNTIKAKQIKWHCYENVPLMNNGFYQNSLQRWNAWKSNQSIKTVPTILCVILFAIIDRTGLIWVKSCDSHESCNCGTTH